MKKFLAAILAVLMLFCTFSVSATDSTAIPKDPDFGYVNFWSEGVASYDQAVLAFELNTGVITGGVRVYDVANKKYEHLETFEGDYYYMVPYGSYSPKPGTIVQLPRVKAPSGWVFNGWSTPDGEIYVGGTSFTIPSYAAGDIIYLQADYSLAEVEEDTMSTVMDILVKVFGSIIGLLFFSDEYGSSAIEEGMQIMQKVLGSLLA